MVKTAWLLTLYLLTLLVLFFHQIAELTDKQYQGCRKKFGRKKSLWEVLRSYLRLIIFDSWDLLLAFALNRKSFHLLPQGSSP